jgi:hypothetical protein
MDKGVHAPCVFGWQILGDIKILYLTRYLTCKCTGVKMRDSADAGLAVHDILPRLGNSNTDWGDYAQAGYYNSAFSQTGLRSSRNKKYLITLDAR